MCNDDVSRWLVQLSQGDEVAAQRIWEQYFQKLIVLARRKLDGLPLRAVDEEDVALSAMASFCRAVATGRYPQLTDRHDLWRLLVTITSHKAVKQFRIAGAQKRGGGRVRGESALWARYESGSAAGIGEVLGDEPSPEFACLFAETFRDLLEQLGDETLQTIVTGRMEGYSNAEIAERLHVTQRTVQRKIELIRKKWQEQAM